MQESSAREVHLASTAVAQGNLRPGFLQSATSLDVINFPSLGLDTFSSYHPVSGKPRKLSGLKKRNTTEAAPLDYDFLEYIRRDNVMVKCDGPLCILAVPIERNSQLENVQNKSNVVQERATCLNSNGCKKRKTQCGCLVKRPKHCKERPRLDKCAEAKKKMEACKRKCKEKKDKDSRNSTEETGTKIPDPYYPDWDPTRSYENYGSVEPYFDNGFLKFKSKHKKHAASDRKSSDNIDQKELFNGNTYEDSTGENSNNNFKSGQDKITIQAFGSDKSDNSVLVNIKPSSLLKRIIGASNTVKNRKLQLLRTKNVTINYGEEPKVVRSMSVNVETKNLDSNTQDLDEFVKELRSSDERKGKDESRKYDTNSREEDTKVLHLTRNETLNPGSLMHIAKILKGMKPEQLFSAIIGHNQRRALKKWSQKKKQKHSKKSKKSDESEQEESSESTEAEQKSGEGRSNKSKSKSSETEEEEEVEDNKKHKPKRFQVIDSMINRFVEKELFKFNENEKNDKSSPKSSESAELEPLTEEEITTTTKKPKQKKKFKGPGKPMTIIQAPGRMYKEGEDFRRNRLPYFLPKRYDWDPKDYNKLGYFWFNGPQGRNPGPWRIYY
ncbi:cylicin-1-like [Pectinophora gossypiella]|uniref:cylicin-1-like n=1 Tax=Pectinophora gossypiella TaxID=13191 RepID=UPI00214E7075|nr:cylicin-1-like [Pectinophora gossypiella]